MAVVLGAILILSPYDNGPTGASDSVVAASPTPTARPRVKPGRMVTGTQVATPTPDMTSAPAVQDPADAASGGDQFFFNSTFAVSPTFNSNAAFTSPAG